MWEILKGVDRCDLFSYSTDPIHFLYLISAFLLLFSLNPEISTNLVIIDIT